MCTNMNLDRFEHIEIDLETHKTSKEEVYIYSRTLFLTFEVLNFYSIFQ